MDINQFSTACKKTLAHLEQVFGQLQVGRASTGLVENINIYVESWGMQQKLHQVASLTIIDAQTIKIEPRDKSILSDIEKAIYDADLGFTPLNQGEYILIKVPPLTEERRKELTKIVSKDAEDAKISIRNHRQDARKTIDRLFQDDDLSENEKNSREKKIDEITQDYNEKIETMAEKKEKEIMKI